MEYDNTNKGAAWMVDHKQEEWHADAKGSQNVEGNEFWLDVKINATPDVASRIMKMIQENKDNPKAPDFKVTVSNHFLITWVVMVFDGSAYLRHVLTVERANL